MKYFLKLFLFVWKTLWYGFAVATVLVAALFSIARLLLPTLGDYSVTVEKYFTQFVNQPIKIQSLDAEWQGFGPSLVLNNVRLLDKQGKATILRVSKASLGFGFLQTIKTAQLGFSSLDLDGVDLSLVRQKDGHISLVGFEIMKAVDTVAADDDFLRDWLFQQGRIGLTFRNLLYEDQLTDGRKYHFSDVAVSLRNQGDRHLIEGWVGIPKTPGEKMTILVDATGDMLQSDQWSGKIYVSGKKINVINLISSLTPVAQMVTVGVSDFEIWSTWNKSRLERLTGNIDLQNFVIRTPVDDSSSQMTVLQDVANYQRINGRFDWRMRDQGWRLNADNVVLKKNNSQWPASHIAVNYQSTKDQQHQISASGSYVRIHDLTPLLKLLNTKEYEYSGLLQKTEAEWDMRDFKFQFDSANQKRFELVADISNVYLKPYQKYPGVKNLSGQLHMDSSGGHLSLNAKNTILNMPRVFRNPILLQKIAGELSWQSKENTLYLTGRELALQSDSLTAEVLLDAEMPDSDNRPYLNLIATFKNGYGNEVSRKLPAKVMPQATVAWLDRAIVDGYVPEGRLIFHGNARDFPFEKGNGVFKVRFDVTDGELDYAKGWPKLENAHAAIEFNGPSLTIDIKKGVILNSQISNSRVSVADLKLRPLRINIQGDVRGATQDKMDYALLSPPLRKKFGQFFQHMEAQGDSLMRLDVELDITKKGAKALVNGDLDFTDNSLKSAFFGEVLTNINGKINLKPYGLEAKAIKAHFYGQPTRIDLTTKIDKKTKQSQHIELTANGRFDARDLSVTYLPVLSDLVGGKSKWKVTSKIPLHESKENNNKKVPIRFLAQSNLSGVEVRLPTPFDKTAKQRFPTKIEGTLYPDKKYIFTVRYSDRFDGIAEYNQRGGDVWRGEFRFGGGAVKLPEDEGFRFTGHLSELSVDVWRNLITQIGEQTIESAATERQIKKPMELYKFFHSADLTIDHFEIFGQDAKNMLLNMKSDERKMLLTTNSDELLGEISIPYDFKHDPLVLNLDRWELTSASGGGQAIDPRSLPALKVYAKSVSYKNRMFGSVKLETTKLVEGLRLEQLIVNPRSTTISAHGKWTVMGDQQQSDFELHLESTNLGQTMDDLDYIGSINGGEGNIDVDLSWPGPLTVVDLERLQGGVSIKFNNGKLLAIDSGAGRVFGLFSLQTLPKRLLLDFSDLYEKGIVFNVIEGNFNIEDGDAYTNNFYMDGPGAKAQVAGRIGLASQDYDQLLTFIPQTADIASIVGLLFATPWGFVIPQIFKEDINKAMSFQYTLTGDWVNPKLEPVIKVEPLDLIDE